MNGPTPVEVPTTINRPKNKSTNTSGIIHHIFRRHKNTMSSPAIPNFIPIDLSTSLLEARPEIQALPLLALTPNKAKFSS